MKSEPESKMTSDNETSELKTSKNDISDKKTNSDNKGYD